jgi:hypothetical protein
MVNLGDAVRAMKGAVEVKSVAGHVGKGHSGEAGARAHSAKLAEHRLHATHGVSRR